MDEEFPKTWVKYGSITSKTRISKGVVAAKSKYTFESFSMIYSVLMPTMVGL
jgi:hypothetical protein